MLTRHELPPLIPQETVQTSVLDIQPDPDISGMIVSLRDRVNKRKDEVLDTSDPLPLHAFGPFMGLGTALILISLGIGIFLGIMALIEWIRVGMEILPLGKPW